MTAPEIWCYRARPVRVVDGDTVDVEVDLGFGVQLGMADVPIRLRLLGVNAPELRRGSVDDRARGVEARRWVAEWLEGSYGEWPLTIETVKSDSFGRWLARIWRPDGAELCADIVAAGHAEVWTP